MIRPASSVVWVVLFPLAGQVVDAQTPSVYTHLVSFPDPFNANSPDVWEDITSSVVTLNLPAGTAFITWSFDARRDVQPGSTLFRAVVGDNASPPLSIVTNDAPGLQKCFAGSWTTATESGDVTVKLQLRQTASGVSRLWGGEGPLTWTLIVFAEGGAAPAMGTSGLIVLTLALLAVGSVVISRRQRVAPR